jgi:hypothetical protein
MLPGNKNMNPEFPVLYMLDTVTSQQNYNQEFHKPYFQ